MPADPNPSPDPEAWGMPSRADRIAALALSFPTLSNAPGVCPWSPPDLDAWSQGPAPESARHAVRLVLGVWDPLAAWSSGRFDVMDALLSWDDEHRAAFLAWVRRPWWA